MTQYFSKSLLLACLINLSSTAIANTEIIQTESGSVQGLVMGDVETFKGIPFAAPPVGELRWRAPQPAKPWHETLQATEFGDDCLQTPFPGDEAPLRTAGSEDCLTLNIWRPTTYNESLPVMVWLYGGGLVNGGTSPAIYDGTEFAKKGVIFVSANYRIGRFGFFAHPALSAEYPDEVKNNYGFLDQQAALRWVRDNIAHFGGDPNNISLLGESAGGFSIHTHLTTPLTERLFHKVIIQSGGGRELIGGKRLLNQATKENPLSAEDVGMAFAKRFGITGKDSHALDALRALSAQAIVSGLHMGTMMDETYGGTAIDGKLITDIPEDIYTDSKRLGLPIMIGANALEIGFAPQVDSYEAALAPLGEKAFEEAIKAYNPQGAFSPQEVADALARDSFMLEPARFVAKKAREQTQDVYLYRFAYVADSMQSVWPAAVHASEIPYAFNTVAARYGDALTAKDAEMAAMMNQYWVNFAKYSDPNGPNLPKWEKYDPNRDNLLYLSEAGRSATQSRVDPLKARLDLIQANKK